MPDRLTEDEYLVATALTDLIAKTKSKEIKYKLAEVRDSIVCETSKLGCYRCTIKPPFHHNLTCDLCLEQELFELWKSGVHTISSCCGHGSVPPYIQVLNGDSVQKMHELGYKEIPNEAFPENPYPSFRPKTYLPCFSPCKECARAIKREDGGGYECLAEDYDTEFNTFWCFVPKCEAT